MCIREAGWNGPARGLRYDDKYNKNHDIIVKRRRRRMMIRMIIIMIMIMILKMIKRIIMILIELWDN